MFIGDYETLSIEEISKIDGLNYLKTVETHGISAEQAYSSTFTYDGWNNDNVIISIDHENKDMIDLTSECEIWIHPIYIDEEEGRPR